MSIDAASDQFSIEHRRIFHYNVPVNDLEAARSFYGGTLGCEPAVTRKRSDERSDYDFFGNHLIVKEVSGDLAEIQREAASYTMVRHFGVFLPWDEFKALSGRLVEQGAEHRLIPNDLDLDASPEEACIFIKDPSGNTIEFKTASDITTWLS